MPESSRPAMNHDYDLTLPVYAHLSGRKLVVDLVHHLDLGVVIPGPEGAKLGKAALLGAGRNAGRVGIEHTTVFFAVLLQVQILLTLVNLNKLESSYLSAYLVFCPNVSFP